MHIWYICRIFLASHPLHLPPGFMLLCAWYSKSFDKCNSWILDNVDENWKHMFKLTIVFIQTVRYVCPKCKMYLSKFWMERVRSKVHKQAYCRSCYFTCCAIWQNIFYLAFSNIHHTSTLQKYRMGMKLKSYIHIFHKLYIYIRCLPLKLST